MRFMGDLLNTKELNEKIQYELQEFHQLNYDSFIHDFTRIAVSSEDKFVGKLSLY